MADDDVQVTDCAATNSPKYPLPFQAPHSFLKGSELVNSSGFVDVNAAAQQAYKCLRLGRCALARVNIIGGPS